MASSVSLKELSKAIVAFLPHSTLPLPEDLFEAIEGYLRRHHKYDEAASDRLQEELFSIYDKHVKGNLAASAPWLAIIRQLLPMLRTADRIFAWWDTSAGMLEKASPERSLVEEFFGGITDVITFAEENPDGVDGDLSTNPLIDRLFAIWMNKLYPSTCDGVVTSEHTERLTRDALVQFGKRHPKDLFTVLGRYFVKKQYRKAVLRFLGDYLQTLPPHLHQILQTTLFTSILTCLQLDTSTTVVSSALMTLIMLLPHMPSSLVPHLPSLFNIYARLLFWSRERSEAIRSPSETPDQTGEWEVYAYEPETEDLTVSHLQDYYTILYGLYPLNFMDYIRKPQRYLRHANVANANDIEIQPTEIRDKSEKFRRCHLLHPNFYSLTIESEKTDLGRWIKSEASEVAAECMDLYSAIEPDGSRSPHLPSTTAIAEPSVDEDNDENEYGTPILSRSVELGDDEGNQVSRSASVDSTLSSRRESDRTRPGSEPGDPAPRDTLEVKSTELTGDSPTLPPQLTQSSSHTHLQDMIQSNKVIKSGLHQSLANDSVPSLSLSHPDSAAERPSALAMPTPLAISSPLSLTETTPRLAHLQRRILILQNDLNFERYLKQQHMTHIGDLRRKHMEEAVTEAEMQNLISTNRLMKNRLEEAKKAEMQVRRDSERSRTMMMKWEAQLSSKCKTLRDETKQLSSQLNKLKEELEDSKAERQKLRQLVCEAEVKELTWQQDKQIVKTHEAEVERFKNEVERLMRQLRDYQGKEDEVKTAVNNATKAEGEAEILRMKLKARELEMQQVHKSYQLDIEHLRTLRGVRRDKVLNPSQIARMEEDLAASRAKQAEMERQYNILSRKYKVLQSSLLDLDSSTSPPPKLRAVKSSEGSLEHYSRETTPITHTSMGIVMPGPTPARKTPFPPPVDILSAQEGIRQERGEMPKGKGKGKEAKENEDQRD